jgi:hypothetical protein
MSQRNEGSIEELVRDVHAQGASQRDKCALEA